LGWPAFSTRRGGKRSILRGVPGMGFGFARDPVVRTTKTPLEQSAKES